MADDLSTKLQVAVWGAVAGGIVSLVMGALAPRIKRWNLTKSLHVYPEPVHGNHVRCRAFNGGFWSVTQAVIYISLDFDKADVLASPSPNERAFISPEHNIPLIGDQLCWSVRSPTINPLKVDIFAKERQPFSPCEIRKELIMIPSEEGWDFPKDGPRIARVFLRRRAYKGALKIVSADTDARFFHIEISPDNAAAPISITLVKASELKFLV